MADEQSNTVANHNILEAFLFVYVWIHLDTGGKLVRSTEDS